MTLIVVGGSNSLLKDGWVARLATRFPDEDIVNLSIGAAPSLMGYYRLLTSHHCPQGATLIWEYALNDEEFIAARDADPAMVLRYVGLILDLCRQRGLHVLGLALATRSHARPMPDGPYRLGLQALFKSRGVPLFDSVARFSAALNLSAIPPGHYSGIFHLASDGPVVHALVDWIVENRSTAPVPARPEGEMIVPVVADRFSGDVQHTLLENSLGKFKAHSPVVGSEITLILPRGQFRIMALILLRTPKAGTIRLTNGTRRQSVSLQIARNYPKPLLAFGRPHTPSTPGLVVSRETPLRLSWAIPPQSMADRDQATGGIVAVLLEPVPEVEV